MVEVIATPVEKYYEEAKEMLKKRDLAGFLENIGGAKALAENNNKLLAKVTSLKVEGLFELKQYKILIDSVSEALKYNDCEKNFKLKKYKGIAYGYLGEFEKAIKIFKELLTYTKEPCLLSSIYINISWIYLTIDKSKANLVDAKKYLDLANEHFEILPDRMKSQIHINNSVYYFYINDYDKAIQLMRDSIEFSEEKDLPKIYFNIAQIYLKLGRGSVELVKEYSDKAEVIAHKYDDKFEIGKAFYTKAIAEFEDEEFFTALDTLYLSFDFFKEAEAYSFAFDCLIKIIEVMSYCKIEYVKSIKGTLQEKLKGTRYSHDI